MVPTPRAGSPTTSSPGDELRRLRELLGDLDAVVWEADASSGRYTFVSERANDILGYPPDAFLDEPGFWAAHLHPEDRDSAVKEFVLGVEEARPHDTEYRFVHADGRIVWVRDIGHTVTDDRGVPLTARGLMMDVTAQKHAEERAEETDVRYRSLLENLPAIVYRESVRDADGGVVYVSPQVREILGLDPEAMLGTAWVSTVHPDDRERVMELQRIADETGEPFAAEYRVLAGGGRVVWIRDGAVLVRDDDGRPRFWQGVMLDVSGEVRAEDLEHDLEVEREETAQLRELDEMKNTFLAAVSHDLRTPLAAILGLAVTLEQQPLGAEDARDLASRIVANARKLERMVSDLLDLDRLTRGIVEPNLLPTDVGGLVALVVAEADVVADREVSVQAEQVVLQSDAGKIERIVENLLANAARHTPPDARIWISIRADLGGALILVEDDGPGVPGGQAEVIFEPFRKAAGTDYSPGVGIGLTLVARFAELLGGRAWVEDRQGGGASFRVWLPDLGDPDDDSA